MKWYYCEELEKDIDSLRAYLIDEEFRHLTTVMRAKEGDRVKLFNGKGLICESEIIKIDKKRAELKIINKEEKKPDKLNITLAVAAIKGERQEIIIRQATELGASEIVILQTDNSEVNLTNDKLERLKKITIASSKQCHRAYLPTLKLKQLENYEINNSFVIVGSLQAKETIADIEKEIEKQDNITIIIGPEGGFSDFEEESFNLKGYTKVKINNNILRTDTAAALMLSYAICTKQKLKNKKISEK